MSDEELRLECLKLANSRLIGGWYAPEHVLPAAEKMWAFVKTGRSPQTVGLANDGIITHEEIQP